MILRCQPADSLLPSFYVLKFNIKKVQFDTGEKKKNGKKRLRWYGGVVSEVKADGGRIRILYDDDTSEMADFPDGDIIVDAEENGKHSKSAGGNNPSLNPFIPPPDSEEDKGEGDEHKESFKSFKIEGPTRVRRKDNSSTLKDEVNPKNFSSPDPPLKQHTQEEQQEKIFTSKKKKLKLRISAKSVSARLSSSSNDESGNLDIDSDDDAISKRKASTKDPFDHIKSGHGTIHLKVHKIEASSPHIRPVAEGVTADITPRDLSMHPVVEDSVSSVEPHDETTIVEEIMLVDGVPLTSEGVSTPKIIRTPCPMSSVPQYPEIESTLLCGKQSEVDLGVANELVEMSRIFREQTKVDEPIMQNSSVFRAMKENSWDPPVIQTMNTPTFNGSTHTADFSPLRPSINGTNVSKQSLSLIPSFEESMLASPDTADKEVIRQVRGALKKGNKRGRDGKETSTRLTKSKRKATDQSTLEDDNEENDENWVQCDRCQKWRLLPEFVDMDGLPERWFCEMNKYDARRNKCSASEQTVKEITEEREKCKTTTPKKRRKKIQECKPTASPESDDVLKSSVEVTSSSLKRTQSKEESIASLDSEEGTDKAVDHPASPRSNIAITKEAAPEGTVSVDSYSIPQAFIPCHSVTDSTEDTEESKKNGSEVMKKGKSEVDSGNSDDCDMAKGKGSRNRRKKEKDSDKILERKPSITTQLDEKQVKVDADESQEWVQCEKCEKWRRLPPRIKAEDLPDVWYCSMNTWDTRSASCSAPEDKAETGTREITILGGADNKSGGGKLTYRNLIFGSGKKQSRPTSERARALDSIFIVPGSDVPGEGVHPTVSYADSSCFVQRGIGQRTKLEETSSAALLELMSKSRLWGDLYSGSKSGRPVEHFSPTLSANQTALSDHERLQSCPKKSMESMKTLIFHALGENTLSTHEVLLEAQCRNWGKDKVENWPHLREICTLDLIDNALKELVKDGIVEEVHGCLPNEKISETKITRYRRTSSGVNNNATRCIKLAKPWKIAANSGKHCRWSDAEECEELLQQAILQARKRFDFLQTKLGHQIPFLD